MANIYQDPMRLAVKAKLIEGGFQAPIGKLVDRPKLLDCWIQNRHEITEQYITIMTLWWVDAPVFKIQIAHPNLTYSYHTIDLNSPSSLYNLTALARDAISSYHNLNWKAKNHGEKH